MAPRFAGIAPLQPNLVLVAGDAWSTGLYRTFRVLDAFAIQSCAAGTAPETSGIGRSVVEAPE